MRLAKITLAILATAILTGFVILACNSGIASKKLDFNVPKLQSKQQKLNNLDVEYEKLNSQSSKLHSSDTKQINELNAEKKQLEQQRQELQKQLQAKAEEKSRLAQAAINTANTVTATSTASADPLPTYSGSHEDWMAEAGIDPSDYTYVDYIVSHEGSWDGTTRYNVGGSGAYGLCQALPASKMASAGDDYMTDPVTQLKWCAMYASYAHGGGWYNNYLFWTANAWW